MKAKLYIDVEGGKNELDALIEQWPPSMVVELVEADVVPVPDKDDGRRWWRMTRGGESQRQRINIAEMEYLWLQGWRPEYPLQRQPLGVNDGENVTQGA